MAVAPVFEWARKWLPLILVVSSISGLGWVQAFGSGAQKLSQDFLGITALVENQRQEALNTRKNTRAIQALSLPTDIFDISQSSGPINGFCVESEPCAMNIRVRRNLAALSCEIVPGTVNYYYRNPRNNEIFDADVLSGRPRDIGTRYINLQFTFSTPSNLIPNAELCVRPEYRGCPGMNLPEDAEELSPDELPPDTISPDEECFDVKIVEHNG